MADLDAAETVDNSFELDSIVFDLKEGAEILVGSTDEQPATKTGDNGMVAAANDVEDEESVYPRTCTIVKGESGFGFTLVGVRPVILSEVEELGAAYAGGGRANDRILGINSVNVLHASHQGVVDMICACKDGQVKMLLLAETKQQYFKHVSILGRRPQELHQIDEFGFIHRVSEARPDSVLSCSSDSRSPTASPQPRPESDAADASQPESPNVATFRSIPQRRKRKPRPRIDRNASLLPPEPENPKLLKEWRATMKAMNKQVDGELWILDGDPREHDYLANPQLRVVVSDEFSALLIRGIPHSLRRQVWIRCSGAAIEKASLRLTYVEIVNCAEAAARASKNPVAAKQISKDLLRTYPDNVFFNTRESEGAHRLRRVLLAYSWLHQSVGYCQGMGMLAGLLLLVLKEEEAFWTLVAIINRRMPEEYYTSTMLGCMTDQHVFRDLVKNNLPRVSKMLEEHGIELSLITVNWFLTGFCSVAPIRTVIRIWDCFLHEGSLFLFKVGLAMLGLEDTHGWLIELDDSGSIFNGLSDIPSSMLDANRLLKFSFSFMHIENQIEDLRLYHRAKMDSQFAEMERRRSQKKLANETTPERSASPNFFQRLLSGRKASTKNQSPIKATSPIMDRGGFDVIQEFEALVGEAVRNLYAAMTAAPPVPASNGVDPEPSNSDTTQPQELVQEAEVKDVTESVDVTPENSLEDADGSKEPSKGDTQEHRQQKLIEELHVPNEKRDQHIRSLIHEKLCATLRNVFEHELVEVEPESHPFKRQGSTPTSPFPVDAWRFIEAATVDRVDETANIKSIDFKEPDVPQEVVQVNVPLISAVSSVNDIHERSGKRDLRESKFDMLIINALNYGCLHTWLEFLMRVARSPTYSSWYSEAAVIKRDEGLRMTKHISALAFVNFELNAVLDNTEEDTAA